MLPIFVRLTENKSSVQWNEWMLFWYVVKIELKTHPLNKWIACVACGVYFPLTKYTTCDIKTVNKRELMRFQRESTQMLVLVTTIEIRWHFTDIHKQNDQKPICNDDITVTAPIFCSCFMINPKNAIFHALEKSQRVPIGNQQRAFVKNTFTTSFDTSKPNALTYGFIEALSLTIYRRFIEVFDFCFVLFDKINSSKWVIKVTTRVLWINPWDRFSVRHCQVIFTLDTFLNSS